MSAHNYWQLLFPALPLGRTSSTNALTEVEFHTSIGGANIAVGGVATGFAQGNASGTPANAFDANTGTQYGDTACTGNTLWGVGYAFVSPVDIVEVVVKVNASGTTQGPPNIILRFSDNGTSWENYSTIQNLTWLANESKTLLTPSNIIGGSVSTEYSTLGVLGLGVFGTLNPRAVPNQNLLNGQGSARAWNRNGGYKIDGTTTQLGVPLARTVNLYEQKSGLLVDVINTDKTGAFSFKELVAGTYSVVGVNAEGNQNSVIYAHVEAIPM